MFGDYDTLPKHELISDIKYIPIVDRSITKEGSAMNRAVKMNPHLHEEIAKYDISIYADSNMSLTQPHELLKLCKMLYESNRSAILFKHPQRTTAHQEALACIRQGVGTSDLLKFYKKIRKEGFEDNIGLTENNILIRKNNDIQLQLCCATWYRTYMEGCLRDQVSLPYARWKTRYDNFFLLEQRIKEEIFKWRPHGV